MRDTGFGVWASQGLGLVGVWGLGLDSRHSLSVLGSGFRVAALGTLPPPHQARVISSSLSPC